MHRSQRLIAATVLAAMSLALAGCSSGNFDPTDLMDMFDTKKKLPGERRPVFPEGVPGVEQGVPRDMYKGAARQDAPPVAETPPPAPEPKAKSSKSAAREAEPFPTPVDDASAPAPKMKKPKRTRITAPEPDAEPAAPAPQRQQQAAPPQQAAPQQQAPSSFPAPLPSGGFAR
ncbi:MAG: hypothetical protein ACJAVZ_001281 [Afipia broomeae]|jgi:hypothetical protein|uniref:Uncharacterized protein n=1 Tax=Afipia broomeae ATCC 49717 TaxID=883078 RepID=K8PFN5_9BRAD|nr:hypothetical protein [Afipia broomeae]EKS39569.1 hypothetical protein HMPREF9695_01530 [Afipia broomeae ATCC 49717]RTL76490.1 MAG: hypothetical protein EKK35_19550 [Bradyrhizobiaceae bacterium]